jgi:hypothetical protein
VPTRPRTWLLISVVVTALAITRFLVGGSAVAGSVAAGLVFGCLTFAFFKLRAAMIMRRERSRSSASPD